MRKNTMFISAALTAFVLAMLAGVVSAYNGISKSNVSAQLPTNVSPTGLSVAAPIPTQPSVVTAQDAASIASTYINRTDLYSVELNTVRGVLADSASVETYKVTFSSGDIVYVSLDGQVLKTTPPPAPVTIYTFSSGGGNGNGKGSAPAAGNNGGERDGGGEGD